MPEIPSPIHGFAFALNRLLCLDRELSTCRPDLSQSLAPESFATLTAAHICPTPVEPLAYKGAGVLDRSSALLIRANESIELRSSRYSRTVPTVQCLEQPNGSGHIQAPDRRQNTCRLARET